MLDFQLYIKQDGMYNTLDIVISNIPIEDIKDWYLMSTPVYNLKDMLFYISQHFMNYSDTVKYVRIIDKEIPDEILISRETIIEMNANKMI